MLPIIFSLFEEMELDSRNNYQYLQFINEDDFMKIKNSGLTFFTVFVSKTCGICDWWLNQVNQVSEKLGDLSQFTVLNCSENEDFCKRIGIPAYPINCIYNDEEEKGMVQFMDALSQKTLMKFIIQHHRRPYVHRDNATALLQVFEDDISDNQIVVLSSKTTPAVFNYKLYKQFPQADLFVQFNISEDDWKLYEQHPQFDKVNRDLEYNIYACLERESSKSGQNKNLNEYYSLQMLCIITSLSNTDLNLNQSRKEYVQDITDDQFMNLAIKGNNFINVFYNMNQNKEDQTQWLQTVNEVAEKYQDRIRFTKFNCQKYQQYCKHLGVRIYPNTTMLSPITDEMFKYFHYQSGKQQFVQWIEKLHKRPFIIRKSIQSLLESLEGDISEQQIIMITKNDNIPSQYYEIGRKYNQATIYVVPNMNQQYQQEINNSDIFKQPIQWNDLTIFTCEEQKCQQLNEQNYEKIIQYLDQWIE